MNTKFARLFRFLLVWLTVMVLLFGTLQTLRFLRFNSTLHTSEGKEETADTYMDIQFRGGDTSSWIKRDLNLNGIVCDALLYNHSPYQVSSWSLRLNFKGDCYLNQFWNGEVEVHQSVASGEEIVQTLNLASYEEEELKLEHIFDASDLLISLHKGDYLIYTPSKTFQEVPVAPRQDTVVGMILYYTDEIDISDYHIDYYYKMSFKQGGYFVALILHALLLFLGLGIFLSAHFTYKNAQKEMGLKISGISCMSNIYAVIYIIDLAANTITPVGGDEEQDAARPKDLSPGDQLQNLFRVDAVAEYQALMFQFADLTTLPERMKDRNSIAVEYESREHGWCRIRFIAMDREKDQPLKKVLFTIQQINEEKKELEAIRMQMQAVTSESAKKSDYLETIFQEARSPVRSILSLNELILQNSHEKDVLDYASEIKVTGDTFLTLVNSALDISLLSSGKMKIKEAPYSLNEMLQEVELMALAGLEDKNITFSLERSLSLPELLIGDHQKLKQILINLVSKVSDDVNPGSIKLRVFGKQIEENKLHLLVSVQECGTLLNETEVELGIRLVEGLLYLMGSKLKSADLGNGKDYYFELDQKIQTSEKSKTDSEEVEHP